MFPDFLHLLSLTCYVLLLNKWEAVSESYGGLLIGVFDLLFHPTGVLPI